MDDALRNFARQVIESEAQAVRAMGSAIGEGFAAAVEAIFNCKGALLLTGVGKAGHVARKLSATFASTGTPSHFLSPGDSVHGDLGSIRKDDIVLILSFSGESDEILRLVSIVKKLGNRVMSITRSKASGLGKASDPALEMGKIDEACPLGLAPSSTTTAMLALGDALALTVMHRREFKREDFALFHPAGQLGRKLMKVSEAMTFIRDHNLPLTLDTNTIGQVLDARTALGKKLDERERKLRLPGAIVLIDHQTQELSGIFTDGDLRRLVISSTSGAVDLSRPVSEVMTRTPKCIRDDALASEALAIMRTHRIDELVVVAKNNQPIGLIDIQDLVVLKMLDVEPET